MVAFLHASEFLRLELIQLDSILVKCPNKCMSAVEMKAKKWRQTNIAVPKKVAGDFSAQELMASRRIG